MRTPASTASRTWSPDRSSRLGRPLTSSATPVSSATSIVRSRSSAFSGRCPISRPVGWLRQRTAGWRIASVDACREFPARRALPAMERRAAPSRARPARRPAASRLPSLRMSHSTPRRILNGASCSFAAAISSPWRRSGIGVESRARRRRPACDRRSRGTRSLAPAQRSPISSTVARPSDHGRVRVQVAADLVQVHECRRLRFERALRISGGGHGEAELAGTGRLVGRLGQRPERGDVLGWSGRADESRRRARQAGAMTSSIGIPSAVMPGVRIEQSDDLGQGREALADAFRIVRRDDDGEAASARPSNAARRPPVFRRAQLRSAR